jgi:hypothetical protein
MGYFQASGPPADDANDSASTASAPIVPATTDNTVGLSAIGSEPNTAEPGTPSLHLSFVSVPSVDANVSLPSTDDHLSVNSEGTNPSDAGPCGCGDTTSSPPEAYPPDATASIAVHADVTTETGLHVDLGGEPSLPIPSVDLHVGDPGNDTSHNC